ncbi:MAG: kelch repeat-containing protein, partial [Chloroflexota bacterium]|nr:kelch repeat-containing protein [Chloroflexota bacterium]
MVILLGMALSQASVQASPAAALAAGNQQPGRPAISAQGTGVQGIAAQPQTPSVILYDQYTDDVGYDNDSYNDSSRPANWIQSADDFVVPSGQSWQVTEVDARAFYGVPSSFNVYFYLNSGTLPATPVYTATALSVGGASPDYQITLTTPPTLGPGTYWLSVQANASYWYWEGRNVGSNNIPAQRNPSNQLGCDTGWTSIQACIAYPFPGLMFRLVGNDVSQVTPSATATVCAATPSAWSYVASYPLAGERIAVTNDGTYIYAAGAYILGAPVSNSFNRYDPAANSWTALPNMPAALYDASAIYAANTNSIYVMG